MSSRFSSSTWVWAEADGEPVDGFAPDAALGEDAGAPVEASPGTPAKGLLVRRNAGIEIPDDEGHLADRTGQSGRRRRPKDGALGGVDGSRTHEVDRMAAARFDEAAEPRLGVEVVDSM